ncbi:methylenetetrahydrofolate reductase [Acinetobacter chinensis]|uniref:Methylenetetrahydrofolate reductase n=1 Tax=Acinetobacter chinensis TaxID=2004650 RepID=A0A3B7LYW1_9GAMM|nr:methylenetetrahydrofolate reductase C-terminal domain-containing protein [Acinetobacter chinensis]AXY56787.1 methylenetetrahydrofolate reductase [Acinetobacter chinensis]
MSSLTHYLSQQQFCFLVEYLSSDTTHPVAQEIAGFPALMTLVDRVHSDEDPAPLNVAQRYPSSIEKIIHFAGKDRDIADFEIFLNQAKQQGIQNLLLLTGDKLKQHQYGSAHLKRTRYLESINAVVHAKQKGGFCIGVAFNPFKYAEAERDAQYFKLHKKIKAGADFIITQLGYDLSALKQVKLFLSQQQVQLPILACVMPLNLARARYMVKQQVAGIVITPHMLNILEREKQQGLTERVYIRCALQILICQHLGLAGIHLSACYKKEEQEVLTRHIDQYRDLSLVECEYLWNSLWEIKTGKELIPVLRYYSKPAPSTDILKYQHLHFMHEALFNSRLGSGMGKFIFQQPIWSNKFVARTLLKTEELSKHSVLGCESCGQCRLGETLYICPETCPKGLANGPCGGTILDRCEFGDRECIHSVKARLAKAVEQTEILKNKLIPTVPVEVRGTSSWKNWYLSRQA